MTAHELARKLLEMPDKRVYIEVDILTLFAQPLDVHEDDDGDVMIYAATGSNCTEAF